MNNERREVWFADLLSFAISKASKAIRVGMPGRIESFDAASQTAKVKPLLFEHDEAEDGSEQNEAIGVISGVPVQFPTAGGFILTFPVKAGDLCWLQFGDRSLEKWFKNGDDVDPVDLRRHALSDAIAILGVLPDPKKISEFDADRLVLGKQGGKRIAFEDSKIHLGVDHGESATDAIALAPATKGELKKQRDYCDAQFAKLSGHTHDASTIVTTATVSASVVVGVQSGDTGPGPSLDSAPSVSDVAAINVFGK